MPLISVIIPTYNREKYVSQAIDSVLAQTFTDYEVIVCDDGSTDRTSDALARYADRIRIVRTKQLGPGGARNAAAKLATGDYLSFLDSDDMWHPEMLSYVNAILTHPARPRLVFSSMITFSESPVWLPSPVEAFLYRDMWEVWESTERPPNDGMCMCIAMSRHAFAGAGGFAEGRITGEDADLFLRLATLGPVVYLKGPQLLAYRSHKSQISREVDTLLQGCQLLLRNRPLYPASTGRRGRNQMVYAKVWHMFKPCLGRSPLNPLAWQILMRVLPSSLYYRVAGDFSRTAARRLNLQECTVALPVAGRKDSH